ncbi:Plasmodium exported protein (PHIST), unknown function [Plasmodium knowlesi strain H]|uniref:Plasmodium RESA N-terminal domain-containing protein n=3 Tax=Plasmodium knowlesi TaxID=5850 RepID=A0A5K1U526_PLAKH|nr:Plasmodium exported protein (PHISTc), unknown function [Plasmodium knowlesi strain H]OTN68220.1 Uncharacterized protein PKNOH_S03315500 [Plasmodium knowlesi]CAA9987058.1 Plasmodium exported protein (PHISTc), unknown function [Plasmodium knowlesi strain H]SBO23776.1 Plasmodium exported protein (PHIST), unknown function [Plasmodium knowlesi strain H]SBO25499.1 Plasmodium exported protein (PHIST), unknown function [Plasmodium knowlesi strain H]VVS76532.1 Plasmodium exported protein (PHISTc), u|eukprot:XP_002261681.1 hypothetical protein, conserved in Plasmodium species [Plasmodium knowlesi strain H]
MVEYLLQKGRIYKIRKMDAHLRFGILGLLNMLLVCSMFFWTHQENGLTEQPLSSMKEGCIEWRQRKLATFTPRAINDEIDEDDEVDNTSSGSSEDRQGNGNNLDEHYRMNNGKAENTKNRSAINYVHNDIEDTYELADNDMTKENENRKKDKNYDRRSYENNENEFLNSISEDEVNKMIEKLGQNVDVKEMFIIWNYVNGFERSKYINMQKNIIAYCENLTSTYNISKKIKSKEGVQIYYYMKDELFYQERKFLRKLHAFLGQGPCSKELFVEFINQTKLSWRNFRRGVNKVCMDMLNSTMKRGGLSTGVPMRCNDVV